MFRNYLVVAWRNLVRNKLYSLINVLGLAIGIALCILSYLFVSREWSYDNFHEHRQRIYLLRMDYQTAGKPWASTPPVLAPTLREHFPELERVVRVYGWFIKDGTAVRYGDRLFNMSGLLVDPEFFEMFSFPQVSGNLKQALEDPNSVVITRDMAHRYFGEEDPLGKRLSIRVGDQLQDFAVTGVTDLPENSSIRFDFLLSHAVRRNYGEGWFQCNVYTFFQLRERMDPAGLEAKFVPFFEQFFSEQKRTGEEFFGDAMHRLKLLPFEDLYLNTVIGAWLTLQSDPVYSCVLSGIALAVLLIACVNFINLSLGLSATRRKEIGVRKVLGALRLQLAKQFWGEAVLLSLLALLLGVGLAELCLPLFNDLTQRDLRLDYGAIWPALIGIALVVGLVTGVYPALVLSRFQPVEVMKGTLRLGGRNWFSQTLVAVQFALSIVLIVATLLISRQLAFLRKMNLGFNAEQVMVIDIGERHAEGGRILAAYRQFAAQQPRILSLSMANMSFGTRDYFGTVLSEQAEPKTSILTYTVDYDYLKTLEMALIAGRDFSPDFPTDEKEALLVNESLVEFLHLDDPVGKEIPFDNDSIFWGRIIGVVRDSHVKPLHDRLGPALFRLRSGNGWLRYILVRIAAEDIPGTLASLKDTWYQTVPDQPFAFSFLDEDVDRTFREDERWMAITRYSALVAIFVACLGVFGLTSLTVARRTKEIGIRKVLGASVPSIVMLLSKEFTYLVLAANLIAWPLAWYAMNRWLQSFAYRIELGPEVFVLGGVLALLIAWLTVSCQAIRAARANPVEALRYE
jgi:putative ABC transport system permease protein